MGKIKTNFQILEENRKAVLSFANNVPQEKQVSTPTLQDIENNLVPENLTNAIAMLDQIKDNNLGIKWYKSEDLGNGTKALVRDARNVTKDTKALKVDAPEKYAMQILNLIRGGISLIDNSNISNKDFAKEALMNTAKNAISEITTLPKKVKIYNSNIINIMQEIGIEEPAQKLVFAKEIANFKDEHKHIVTLTSAKDNNNKLHTVTEADIMLNGLTNDQRLQWSTIANLKGQEHNNQDLELQDIENVGWFNNMPDYKKHLLIDVAWDIAKGNKVIPTQLLSDIPGIKNAYQKVTAIKSSGQSESTILSQTLHSGTPATKIKVNKKEKQAIVREQIKQLQSFVPDGEPINLNILTSKTPFNARGENTFNDQLIDATKTEDKVKISASPINKWRIFFGGGRNNLEFRNILKDIGKDLIEKKYQPNFETKGLHYVGSTKNIGDFLQKGDSLLENTLEKLSFGRYKSTKTKAQEEINSAKKIDKQLGNVLQETMKARKLVDSNTIFSKGNINLKIGASMNIIRNAVKLENGVLRKRLSEDLVESIPHRIDFCKSGKDRTNYLNTKITHETVSSYLGVNPKSKLGQQNMLWQVAGGHTQEMAGIQGGSIGCHSIKTNPEFALSSDPQDRIINGIINQKSSHFNSKIKTVKIKKVQKAPKNIPITKKAIGDIEKKTKITTASKKNNKLLKPTPTSISKVKNNSKKQGIKF